jgi:hypothetical protein
LVCRSPYRYPLPVVPTGTAGIAGSAVPGTSLSVDGMNAVNGAGN